MKFWQKLSHLILKNRALLIGLVLLSTAYMGYRASQIRLSYELARILPVEDANYQLYEEFKARYGEDGNVMVIGIETDRMFTRELFNDWYALGMEVKQIDGIKQVLSNANLFDLVRNDSLNRFDFKPLVTGLPTSQAEVDSIKAHLDRLPFYEGFVISEDGRAHLMAVTFDQKKLNSKSRITMAHEIRDKALAFGEKNKLDVHLSGMPYIRTEFMSKVSREMGLFMILAFVVTAIILLAFFRSIVVALASAFVVGLGVVWSLGLISVFGFQITLLSGLIPPLLIVIGIPNSIFLINRYQQEFAQSGDQQGALALSIEKSSETTFWANVTTAIGFGVFYLTGSALLTEFGLVASLSVMITFAISIIMIPLLFSLLPTPTARQMGHLEAPRINAFLALIGQMVRTHRPIIYGLVAIVTAISIYGITKITAIGYVVDDLPQKDPVYADLKFFEEHFKGVLPFEVSIDTGRPGGVLDPRTLTKIRVMQKEFASYSEITRPLSVVEAIKFFYQAYRGGDPRYFNVPGALELNKLAGYAATFKGKENSFGNFMDSTRQYTRVSFQIADVGTKRITELYSELQPRIDTIFNYDASMGQWKPAEDRVDARITGNSVVFTKGNDYLQKNLVESTILAIVLISVIMGLLFGNLRMIAIAIIPSTVPLIVTAGLMGFFDIHLKPSTILIFSIAFGLSSDGTIYFLTKYKDELRSGGSIADAVARTIQSSGISMFYTAMILFAGFSIFGASTFQGTIVLGILVSITLLMGMASNLILLPAFLMSLDKRIQRTQAKKEELKLKVQ
ncbi:efflux RND transporter permease subunit [Arundinibacter roseus]|uniref:Patched family protein n=1 Tax=Arundinibacter roseus TaxID=2070510 RepID=A0A4R4KGV8_9BACT|nr:MMPL family transporter [Arundinibacter roseus]TDB65831.1 patched family protein [Arundinibacter roseus]